MSNYIYNSLRSEQSQIDTLLEVLEAQGHNLTHQQIEGVEALESYEYFSGLDIGLDDCDDDAIIEAVRDRIMESVLEVSTITTKRILLGCGGPTRYIEINFNEDNEIIGGEYFDNSKAMNDPLEQEERYLTCDEAEAFAYRYGLGEG